MKSLIYIEPDNQLNKRIIPEEIWDSHILGGDLNKMSSNLPIIERIYHIKT